MCVLHHNDLIRQWKSIQPVREQNNHRIIELREDGVLDKECTYDEFLEFRAERLKNGKS